MPPWARAPRTSYWSATMSPGWSSGRGSRPREAAHSDSMVSGESIASSGSVGTM